MTSKNDTSEIFFDIETIPSQEPWVRGWVEDTIKPPGNIKNPESIEKWMAEKKADAIEDKLDSLGFEGATNHIICLACAIDNGASVDFTAATIADEAKIITAFYSHIEANTNRMNRLFIGHNIAGFDLRILRQRSIVLGIKIPRNIPFAAKPWDANPFDTMVQWTGSARDFVKLDLLAKAFGLPGKQNMDGSMVYPAWKEGRIAEIASYCRDVDVPMTRDVYRKMKAVF